MLILALEKQMPSTRVCFRCSDVSCRFQ